MQVQGSHIIYGFHGEFWKNSEANQFLHFSDSGLFVGQFGRPNHDKHFWQYAVGRQGTDGLRFWALSGNAGNAFSPSFVTANATRFVYHNDESSHGGVHRWRLDGADDVAVVSSRLISAAAPPVGPSDALPVGPAARLQSALDAAITAGDATFSVPPGDYNFSTANFDIHNARDLAIKADDVTLWFACTTAAPSRCAGVNISNSERVNISGLTIDYHDPPHGRLGVPGITFNLLNCTDVVSERITIVRAPFFSVTAFNGGGGHVFRQFNLSNVTADKGPDPLPHQRDAFHFTDLRRGVTLEDSFVAGCGDDFFNAHNTIMVVLAHESPTSLLIVNPHLQNVQRGKDGIISNRNTVYGTNCALQNLRSGDSISFYGWPECVSSNGGPPAKGIRCTQPDQFVPPLIAGGILVAEPPDGVEDASTVAAAAVLAHEVATNHSTQSFDASDVWRVRFQAAVPPAVTPGTLVNLDAFSTPRSVVRNNSFTGTRYNLGRWKSNDGVIANNSFASAGAPNLEISPLLQFFEGNLPLVRGVTVEGNMIVGEGANPIHCSAMCSRDLPNASNPYCPECTADGPFAADTTVANNTILP